VRSPPGMSSAIARSRRASSSAREHSTHNLDGGRATSRRDDAASAGNAVTALERRGEHVGRERGTPPRAEPARPRKAIRKTRRKKTASRSTFVIVSACPTAKSALDAIHPQPTLAPPIVQGCPRDPRGPSSSSRGKKPLRAMQSRAPAENLVRDRRRRDEMERVSRRGGKERDTSFHFGRAASIADEGLRAGARDALPERGFLPPAT